MENEDQRIIMMKISLYMWYVDPWSFEPSETAKTSASTSKISFVFASRSV